MEERTDCYQEVQNQAYDCLLFDVDETLYPLSSGLSAQVTKNIQVYMIEKLGIDEKQTPELCFTLYKEYGTTMAGLRAIGYNFDYDDFHACVHGILPYEILKPDYVLKHLLLSLPIRKVVFSNADKRHAARVISRLGLEECFEQIISFETLNPIVKADESDLAHPKKSGVIVHSYEPISGDSEAPKTPVVCKPFEDAFEQVFKIADINPKRTLFFDDSIRNLETGKRMGLHTVMVGTSHKAKCVDYALESIHNIKEAIPDLWEDNEKTEKIMYPEKMAIETMVRG